MNDGPIEHNDIFIIRDQHDHWRGTERREENARKKVKNKRGWTIERIPDVFMKV